MPPFIPCLGKTACRDDGLRCTSCSRTFDEITRTRDLISDLAALAIEYSYANDEEFAAYVAHRVRKGIAHQREQRAAND